MKKWSKDSLRGGWQNFEHSRGQVARVLALEELTQRGEREVDVGVQNAMHSAQRRLAGNGLHCGQIGAWGNNGRRGQAGPPQPGRERHKAGCAVEAHLWARGEQVARQVHEACLGLLDQKFEQGDSLVVMLGGVTAQ